MIARPFWFGRNEAVWKEALIAWLSGKPEVTVCEPDGIGD